MSTIPAARLDHATVTVVPEMRAAATRYVLRRCREDVDLVLAMLGLED